MPPVRCVALIALAFLATHLASNSAFGQFLIDVRSLPVSSAVTIDEADSAFSRHIERGRALLADKQWEEGLETLLRIQTSYADKLVRLGAPQQEFSRAVPAREYVHLEIAALAGRAPEALDRYRQRVDPLAERWYRQGIADRNSNLLERVVRDQFASSWGDDCLLAAGELALERGDFTGARSAWEQISPVLRWPDATKEAEGRPGLSLWQALRGVNLDHDWAHLKPLLERPLTSLTALAYPDTNLNLADIRARLALVSALEGDIPRARLELELLKRLHPDASGHLAGKNGKYSDTLEQLIASNSSSKRATAKRWPTFGGSYERGCAATASIDPAGRQAWSVGLGEPLRGDHDVFGSQHARPAEGMRELLSYHLVVAGNLVFLSHLADKQLKVRALRLDSGEPAWPRANSGLSGEIFPTGEELVPLRMPIGKHLGVPRFTLTVYDNQLFFRCGAAATNESAEGELPSQQSQIVGLDLLSEGRMLPGFPISVPDANWAFEGAPICDGSQLFVAIKQKGSRPNLHVASYSLATGRLRWRRSVSSADSSGKGELPEISHALLSLSGSRLYVNTNLGAVACLTKDTGDLKWLTMYPRSERSPDSGAAHWFRDLTPCLIYRDQLFVAPQDCERIFSLDATSGRLLWQCRPTDKDAEFDAIHLLGVGEGHLIASGRRLWWIDIQSGAVAARFPDHGESGSGLAGASPEGFGRGVLVGNEVFFPTRERIHVFRLQLAEPGKCQPSRQAIDLLARGMKGGNLVATDEWLLVAGSDKLYALASTAMPAGTPRAPAIEKRADSE